MALGIGLTITNTKAVMEALIGKQSAFARTPKYRVESQAGQGRRDQVSQAAGMGSVAGVVDWRIFRHDRY